MLTSAGAATGQAAWALTASSELTAVLSASRPAFLTLRIVSAAYLIYLALHSLRQASSCKRASPLGSDVSPAYLQGLLSNLGNPKMAVFLRRSPSVRQRGPRNIGYFARFRPRLRSDDIYLAEVSTQP